jgi:hypothetical protein
LVFNGRDIGFNKLGINDAAHLVPIFSGLMPLTLSLNLPGWKADNNLFITSVIIYILVNRIPAE